MSPGRLRIPPKISGYDSKELNLSVGDSVEVLAGKPFSCEQMNEIVYQAGDLPPSWWPARVVKIRGEFVVVHFDALGEPSERFPSLSKPHLDNAFEICQVRPKSTQRVLSVSDFLYHVLDVPKELAGL